MDLQTALTGFQTKQRKVLEPVDHGKIQYEQYRKNFYVEVPELTRMTQEGQLIKLIRSSPTTEYLIQKRLIELRGHAYSMCVVQMSSSCTHSNTSFCCQCVQRYVCQFIRLFGLCMKCQVSKVKFKFIT